MQVLFSYSWFLFPLFYALSAHVTSELLSSSHGYLISLFHAFVLHSVGMLSAAITPGGSGSTPALIGGLSSLSIPLGGATALSI